MQRLEEKSSASVGDRTPADQSVVRHYTPALLDVGYKEFIYLYIEFFKGIHLLPKAGI
jgi:hypothetical protein